MSKRNPEFFRNNLPENQVAEMAAVLIAGIGESDAISGAYIADRAKRGWCAAEIARAYVRREYEKGDPMRRKLLGQLTKAGAPPVTGGF